MSKKQKKQESARTQRRREERKTQKLYEDNLNLRNYDEESELEIISKLFDSDEEMNEYIMTIPHSHSKDITDYMKKGYKFIDRRFPVSEKEKDEAIKVVNDGGIVIMYYSEDYVESMLMEKNGKIRISRIYGVMAVAA